MEQEKPIIKGKNEKKHSIKFIYISISGTLLLIINYLTDFINILDAFGSDGIFITILEWIEKEIKYPSGLTIIIVFVLLLSSVIHLTLNISKRKDNNKPSIINLLIGISEFIFIIFVLILLVNNNSNIDNKIDPSKYIGIVYNPQTTDTRSFKNYIMKSFSIIKGREGSNMDVRFCDKNSTDTILTIDNFVKEERIRYLILSEKINESDLNQLLKRGKEKFILIKTIPFDISENTKNNIVAMYYGANQEVSVIIKSLKKFHHTEVILIHPSEDRKTNYQKEFIKSIKDQGNSQNINVRLFSSAEIEKAKAILNSTNINQLPPIVFLSQNLSDLTILNSEISQKFKVFLSVNYFDPNILKSISVSEINIPVPWPSTKDNSIPINFKLIASVVETVTELDNSYNNKNGKRIKELREELFKSYKYFKLRLTQSLLGTTSASFLVSKNDFCNIIYYSM